MTKHDEAVEAMARALWNHSCDDEWGIIDPVFQKLVREEITAALAADPLRQRLGEEAVEALLEGAYIIPKSAMTDLAIKSFERFLNLTMHGAKYIDIKVRKDGKEYEFQADFLKHTLRLDKPQPKGEA